MKSRRSWYVLSGILASIACLLVIFFGALIFIAEHEQEYDQHVLDNGLKQFSFSWGDRALFYIGTIAGYTHNPFPEEAIINGKKVYSTELVLAIIENEKRETMIVKVWTEPDKFLILMHEIHPRLGKYRHWNPVLMLAKSLIKENDKHELIYPLSDIVFAGRFNVKRFSLYLPGDSSPVDMTSTVCNFLPSIGYEKEVFKDFN